MNDLLQSLRSDLSSRRLLPFVALALLALAVALGYALAGAGSTPPPRASAPSGGSSQQAALTVVAASANPNAAEAETPGGLRYQSGGPTRNPFTPLPGAKSATTTSASASKATGTKGSTSGSSGSGSGAAKSGGSGAGKSGGTEPAPTPPKPSAPSKPAKKAAFPYDVSILFGKLPATAGQEVTLPPYQNLQPQRPIPSASDERIALERVGGNAGSAVFALLAPAILRGQGVCLPSPSECQHLSLEVGHAEELEYVEADGQSFVYELKTVSIVKSSSQTAG
ncbi:MAG TPA: hypothetical protein VHS55_04335 [Solirubrobacteraceae bacterium]|jgi:hypothetical protein|nr:hypothetical protein [Solirubrobacteraceae bacterium]